MGEKVPVFDLHAPNKVLQQNLQLRPLSK